MSDNSLLFKLNEIYNRNLEQKISGSIFAVGGVGAYFLRRKLRTWAKNLTGTILDVGSGDKKYKKHISGHATYISLDYIPAAISCPWRVTRPNIVGNGLMLPLKDGCVDGILNTFVIEHVESPDLLIRELSRILKNGGFLVLCGPGDITLSHGEPFVFYNMTKYAYENLLKKNDLEIIEQYFPIKSWLSILGLIYMQQFPVRKLHKKYVKSAH